MRGSTGAAAAASASAAPPADSSPRAYREKKEKKEKKEKEEPAADEPEETPAAAEPVAPSPVAASPSADGICKCFLGNLSYSIEDDAVREFFKDCGPITDIHWLTDKESGQFYGSGFIEFGTPEEAKAALAKAGEDLMGRPLKIDLAKPRAPRADGSAAGGFKKKPFEVKPLGPKPDGCNTVFMGNLSYQIDEDAVKTFFADCGEISNIRWLTDRETGDFKGCGFCEFASSDSVDGVVAKNGQDLMGRPVRLDYSTPKPYDYSTPRRCSPFLSVSLSVCLSVCAAFVLTLCPLYLQWTVGRRSGKVCQHSSSLVLPDEMGMDCDSRLYTNTCVFS